VSKILVTGATGFIGKALVLRLKSLFIDVIPLSSNNGDITDIETLEWV